MILIKGSMIETENDEVKSINLVCVILPKLQNKEESYDKNDKSVLINFISDDALQIEIPIIVKNVESEFEILTTNE